MRKDANLLIRLTDEQKSELKREAERNGVSMGELVVRMFSYYRENALSIGIIPKSVAPGAS